MHIVHVVTRLLRAGSEENTVETCRWQAEAGHRVTLVHGAEWDRHWDTQLPEGVQRLEVPELVHAVRPAQDARALAELRRVYFALAPDVIHTHQSKAGILGRMAASAVPHALVVHGIHIVPFEGVGPAQKAVYLAAERIAARRTDLFIGVSEAVCDTYIAHGLAQPERIACVRSGMALGRFQRATPPQDAARLIGAEGDTRPLVAVMMAAFEPRKRHQSFLEALAWQRQTGALGHLRVLLAGRGPSEEALRAYATRLGLDDVVRFVGYRSDPEALFALSDVSVLTSEREGLPRVAVQSVAAGCPMLVQWLPGIEEVIRDGVNGHVLPPGNMEAVAKALDALAQDPIRLAALRRGARATDVAAWSLEALGAETTGLYLRHLARAGVKDMRTAA